MAEKKATKKASAKSKVVAEVVEVKPEVKEEVIVEKEIEVVKKEPVLEKTVNLVVSSPSPLNLRRAPSLSSKIIETLAPGTKLISVGYFDPKETWTHVTHGDNVGFVVTMYVERA